MYFTPIMYSFSAIPENFQFFLKFNPIYWFIEYARQIILYNQIPSSNCTLYCFVSAFIVLIIGTVLFKKTQDKFIYYL